MDILETLRAETRGDHDALEAVGVSQKIMEGTLTLEDYKRLISVHYLIHKELEASLERAEVNRHFPALDFAGRTKMTLLKKDLELLRIDGIDDSSLKLYGRTPDIFMPYGILGVSYVLEGATLGGMVIVKALKKNEHLSQIKNFYYFGCYGTETGKQWKQFLEVLKTEGTGAEAGDQIIKAAKETYHFFKVNFENHLQ